MMNKRMKFNAAMAFVVMIFICPVVLGERWEVLLDPLGIMCLGALCATASKYEDDSKIAEFIVWMNYLPGIFEFTKFNRLSGVIIILVGTVSLYVDYHDVAELSLLLEVHWAFMYIIVFTIFGVFTGLMIR